MNANTKHDEIGFMKCDEEKNFVILSDVLQRIKPFIGSSLGQGAMLSAKKYVAGFENA